jgi:acetyl-CoA carboxylase carboxyl transferase subunit beta
LHGVSVAVIAQERGRGDAAADRNGGRMSAAGYRKAARLLRLSGHLELPVVTLIDTPGAASGVEAEAAGIGVAMAQAFGLLPLLPVPIVSAVIGEAGGLGALVLGAGDRVLMLERAMYAPAGPEWTRPTSPASELERGERGPATRLSARECQRLGVIDVVVPEPGAGAHLDPDGAARSLGAALLDALAELSGIGPRRLVDERSRRLRNLGLTTPEGREEARREVHELQEWQRSLARSFGEWRGRWEGRTHGRPRLPVSLHRPDLTDLASRLAARRAAVGTRLAGQADEPDAATDPANDTVEARATVDNGRH